MSFSRLVLLPLLALSLLAGCTADSLNGGSDADDDAADVDAGSSVTVSDQPLGGTIDAVPLEPANVEIYYSARDGIWFLSVQNYREPCVYTTSDPASQSGPDKLVVSVGDLAAAAGTYPLEIGDGHGASVQRGVYDASQKPDYTESAAGVLVLDSWTDAPGSTLTGGLHLQNADSNIDGTFTATVCEPR
jgi:hypothetical protein